MKLKLALLTIIVSSIIERQVEANPDGLECYPFRNLTGAVVKLDNTTFNFRIMYGIEIEACRVFGTWLFFSEDYFFGKVNAIRGTGTIYYPRERFVVESMWLVPNKSDQSGIFLFRETGLKYGRFNYFSNETRNIGGRVICKAAIVFGSKDWTVESESKGANSKNVQTCFSAPPDGEVSFVTKVSNLGRILSVTPGKCLGNKITGRTKIPGCTCNWRGAVNDANRCNGKNGICNCLSTHTGYDCGWCKKPLIIQKDGTCKAAEACGCDPRGVDNDYSCKTSNSKKGECNCNPYTAGDKCNRCVSSAAFIRKACHPCYCPFNKVDLSEECFDDTGKCNCLKQFGGDKCESCATNYSRFRTSCLDGIQLNQTILLKSYCDKKDTADKPGKSDVLTLIKAMKAKGTVNYLPWAYVELNNGWIDAGEAACRAYKGIP